MPATRTHLHRKSESTRRHHRHETDMQRPTLCSSCHTNAAVKSRSPSGVTQSELVMHRACGGRGCVHAPPPTGSRAPPTTCSHVSGVRQGASPAPRRGPGARRFDARETARSRSAPPPGGHRSQGAGGGRGSNRVHSASQSTMRARTPSATPAAVAPAESWRWLAASGSRLTRPATADPRSPGSRSCARRPRRRRADGPRSDRPTVGRLGAGGLRTQPPSSERRGVDPAALALSSLRGVREQVEAGAHVHLANLLFVRSGYRPEHSEPARLLRSGRRHHALEHPRHGLSLGRPNPVRRSA